MFNSIFINNSRFRFFTYNSRFNKCFLDPIRFLLSPFNIPTTHAVGGRPWPLSRNNGRGRLPTVCVVGILKGDKKKRIGSRKHLLKTNRVVRKESKTRIVNKYTIKHLHILHQITSRIYRTNVRALLDERIIYIFRIFSLRRRRSLSFEKSYGSRAFGRSRRPFG